MVMILSFTQMKYHLHTIMSSDLSKDRYSLFTTEILFARREGKMTFTNIMRVSVNQAESFFVAMQTNVGVKTWEKTSFNAQAFTRQR